MRKLIYIFVAIACFSCNKRTETAVRLSGLWEIESTNIQLYENNQVAKDSTVSQQGRLALITTDGLQNDATTNLPYAPCWNSCSWEIPKKKKNQLFFSYYTEYTIESTSVMLDSYSNKKLVLVKVDYDTDLNILRKSTWKFKKVKL